MKRKSVRAAVLFALVICAFSWSVPVKTWQSSQPACAPGITFWSLLESVEVGYVDGRLKIDRLYAVCLPFIDGAWNEYGNIFYQRNDPQSPLRFTTWVRNKRGVDNKTPVAYDLKLMNAKNGRLLGQDSGTLLLQPRWLKAELLLRPADGAKGSYLKAADLLSEDGWYDSTSRWMVLVTASITSS